jgi:lysyl-tRNA synthetase class 2
MLEWYRAGGDYQDIVRDIEELVNGIAKDLGIPGKINYQGHGIDITPPWPRVTVKNACLKAAGWDPVTTHDPARFDIDFVAKVQPSFDQHRPTVLTDYPAKMAALARLKPGDPGVAERAEVFIGGLELANAYSELADAAEQERRFREAIEEIKRERGEIYDMPQAFIKAMERMPPCGGVALGIDRLTMLFCDAASIDEVMAFT